MAAVARRRQRKGLWVAVLAVSLCATLLMAWEYGLFLHDWTTEADDPPGFVGRCDDPNDLARELVVGQTGVVGLDAVLVINREARKDRRLRTELVAQVAGIRGLTFVRATEAASLRQLHRSGVRSCNATNLDVQTTGQHVRWRISWATVACRQSHVRAMRAIAQANVTTLVLEDDVDLSTFAGARIPELIALLPNDWHFLRLGGCWEDPPNEMLFFKPQVYHTAYHSCTHAYIVHGAPAAQKWLRLLDEPEAWRPIDLVADKLLGDETYRSFTVVPHLAAQLGDRGDIPTSGRKSRTSLKDSAARKIADLFNVK